MGNLLARGAIRTLMGYVDIYPKTGKSLMH